MSVLTINHLNKSFEDVGSVLKDINLTLNSEEFIIIAGTNSSGKTVLLRHLNGLLRPDSGQILLDGIPIEENIVETRKRIGVVFQNSEHQIIGQTVRDDLAFGPENLRLPAEIVNSRVEEVLTACNLNEVADRPPHLLSGGLKRKVAIAGILAMKPDFIVFDEPFTGLDYPGVIQILHQLLELHRQKHGIILITHELDKVLAHADRLIILDQGEIKHNGHPADLLEHLEEHGIRRPYGAMSYLKAEN